MDKPTLPTVRQNYHQAQSLSPERVFNHQKLPQIEKLQSTSPYAVSKTKKKVVVSKTFTAFNKKKNQEFISSPIYYIGPGNNDALVKRVLDKRPQWKQILDPNSTEINFKWQQSTRGFRYERLNKRFPKQLVNHFENHREITNKQYLVKNLTNYCEAQNMNVFDIIPLTFILDFTDENCDFNLNMFLKVYEQNMPNHLKKNIPEGIQKYILEIKRKIRGYFTFSYGNYTYNDQNKYKLTQTFLAKENGNYLWLLKPTFLNRGRGINIFEDLKVLLTILQEYQDGYVEKSLKQDKKEDTSDEIQKNQLQQQNSETEAQKKPYTIKAYQFVIQKYIEQPALINNRKFDIRVWALLTHELDIYFFKEGYIRTSSEVFDLQNIDNYFIHLTNNAIQKYGNNYGQFEFGNQLSFKQYSEYLTQHKINFSVKQLFNIMHEYVLITFSSVRRKINLEDRKYCFEIFGFDFILDSSYKVWLIEVNTNPCIEESSPLLEMLIPRMLDDAFKLTLDCLFPKLKSKKIKGARSTMHIKKNKLAKLTQINELQNEESSSWPIVGYPDDENLWQLLGTLNERKKYKKK